MILNDYTPAVDLLKDRYVLVTGAGKGIGKHIALTYAKYGASVILLGRHIPSLEQIYEDIKKENLPEPYLLPMDLENHEYEKYTFIADTIENKIGKLHGIVHNAAILGKLSPLIHYPPLLWQQVMQINVHAQFLLTKALLPLLRLTKHSSLIFTTSSVGAIGRAHWGAYAVSKFAVEGMAQVLADEEKDLSTLRVNVINPGAMPTSMRATAYPAEDPKKLCPIEKIMPLYLYLMGKDSHHITGQRFNAQETVK